MAQDNVPPPVRPGQRPSAAEENRLRAAVKSLVNTTGPATVAGDSVAIHLTRPGGIVLQRFVEVISFAVITAGTRWRYLVQPGSWTIEATGAAFDACWTLGPESARYYTISANEINNTSALLPGGEGSDMSQSGGLTTTRKPIPVGVVRPVYWTGSFYILGEHEMVDRSCA